MSKTTLYFKLRPSGAGVLPCAYRDTSLMYRFRCSIRRVVGRLLVDLLVPVVPVQAL